MAALIVIAIFVIGGIYAFWLDYLNWKKKQTQHGSAKWAGTRARSKLKGGKGIYLGDL